MEEDKIKQELFSNYFDYINLVQQYKSQKENPAHKQAH
jgi:hypothetical protein